MLGPEPGGSAATSFCSGMEMSIIVRGMRFTPPVDASWPGSSRPSTPCLLILSKTWMPGTRPGMTLRGGVRDLIRRRAQFGGPQLRRAALRLGVGEVEFDLDPVRIEQEKLVQPLVVDL